MTKPFKAALLLLALLALFSIHLVKITSHSMEPTFQAGDVIAILPHKTYQENDIILFERDGRHITHRIIGKDGNQWITKGDANPTADQQPVSNRDIVGKVLFRVPVHLIVPAIFLALAIGLWKEKRI